jgi:hypothetical protein
MEYMAELTTYKFPPLEERIQEFEKMNVTLKFHMDIHQSNLSDYFINIRNEICKEIKVEADEYLSISNTADLDMSTDTITQGYFKKHIDMRRKCAISIPVSRFNYPLNFYQHDEELFPNYYEDMKSKNLKTMLGSSMSPLTYTGYYSQEHPTATRVTVLHNIPKNETGEIRVILQLCFQIDFHELISKNPSAWKFIPNSYSINS